MGISSLLRGIMFKGKTILVVDDEPDLREILKDEFEFTGAKVLEAPNGKVAIEMVKTNDIDCVVSDIRMPGGDGIYMLRAIKQYNFRKPAVILTTGFADIHPSEAFEIGVEGFITKPFDLDAVREVVEGYVVKGPQRWLSNQVKGHAKRLNVKIESLETALERKMLEIGRGGIFLNFDSSGFYVNDLLEVRFIAANSVAIEFFGIVRWVRDEAEGVHRPGAGIEFIKMDQSNFDVVNKLIEKKNPVAFIPMG